MKLNWRLLRTDSQEEYEKDARLVAKFAVREWYPFDYGNLLACYDPCALSNPHCDDGTGLRFTDGCCALIFRGNRDELIGYVIVGRKGGRGGDDGETIEVMDHLVKWEYRLRTDDYVQKYLRDELVKAVTKRADEGEMSD